MEQDLSLQQVFRAAGHSTETLQQDRAHEQPLCSIPGTGSPELSTPGRNRDTVIHRNDPGMQMLVCTSRWHSQVGIVSALPLPVMSPQTQKG